jgi:hypothetical protein
MDQGTISHGAKFRDTPEGTREMNNRLPSGRAFRRSESRLRKEECLAYGPSAVRAAAWCAR